MTEDNTVDIDDQDDLPEEPDKLTDWAKEPTVRELKQDLQDAQSDRTSHINQIGIWLDNLHVRGKAKVKTGAGKSSIVPRLIRKQAEWRYAALSEPFLSTDDIFNVAPVTHEDKQAAEQNQLVLNNQFNTKMNKTKFIDDSVRTDVDEGTVIWKVGWEFTEEEQDVEVPIMEMQPVRDPALAQEMVNRGQQPYVEVQTGTRTEKQMVTKANHPTVDVCDYRNITIDPSCSGNLDKANFIDYSFQSSLAALKKTGKYKNLDQIVTGANTPISDTDHYSDDDSSFNFDDKPRQLLVVHEYWGFRDIDGSGSLVPIVASYVGDTLIQLERNPFPDQKLPFVTAQYLPVRRSIFGEPDGALLEDNQRIVGAVTRGMIDIMARNANGQKGVRKDALDVTNRRKYDKGEDYEFNVNANPASIFYSHVFPEIPNSAVTMLNMQNAEAESMSGVKAFSSGISGDALGSSVGGIRSALDATSKRELGILRRLAEGVTQIGRKIIAMNAVFLDDEEVIRITNEEFVPVRRDDLAGNFDLKLNISTAEADNEKATNLSFMLQTLGPNMDPAISQIILADIAKLKKMPQLAQKITDYKPEPDPKELERQDLELELLRAKISNERAKGLENETDIGLKRAKTATEEGKARNLNSESDKKDLDFLEQESGLTRLHESTLKDQDRETKLAVKQAGSNTGYQSLPTTQ